MDPFHLVGIIAMILAMINNLNDQYPISARVSIRPPLPPPPCQRHIPPQMRDQQSHLSSSSALKLHRQLHLQMFQSRTEPKRIQRLQY